jgi:hypothetical protein
MQPRRRTNNDSDVLEDEMQRKTCEQLKNLEKSVMQIKQASIAIKGHMIDEEGLVVDIDRGFDKNLTVMKQAMNKIDKMLSTASGSVLCYLLLFVFIVLALLYKLTK